MRSLIAERVNKVFRENLEFLFDRFESQDLCAVVVSALTLHYVSFCELFSGCERPRSYITLLAGTGKTSGNIKTHTRIVIERSFNRLFQSNDE